MAQNFRPRDHVQIPTGDGDLPLFDCQPGGEPAGAVIVLHDAAGATDHNADLTTRFALAGYRAVAPHLYYRTGDEPLSYADVDGMVRHMKALTARDLLLDLGAVQGYLHTAGFADDAIGMVGFCMGGTIGLFAACHLRLGAAVTFYGGGIATAEFGIPPLLEVAAGLKTPWLGLYGDLDRSAPIEDVERLRAEAARADVPTELHRYPEAGHAFHCDIRPNVYHEASARDAWQKTVDWLQSHLAGAPNAPVR